MKFFHKLFNVWGVNSCDEDGPILIGVDQPGFGALESKEGGFFDELLDIDVMEKWICLKDVNADLQILVHMFDVVMLIFDIVYGKPFSESF